jgi:hypothetical protein
MMAQDPLDDLVNLTPGQVRFFKILGVLILLALLMNLGLSFKNNWLNAPDPAPVGLNIPATPAPEVKKVEMVAKPIKSHTVKVYPAAVKNKIKLPEVVLDNPALEVIASSQVKADDHPQTITTLIDTDTGESQTFVKRDPLPWIAWDNRGEAGLYMGIKNSEPTVRLEAKQGLFQVKGLHFGVMGSVDQPLSGAQGTDYFVGAGAWARW